MPRQPKEDLTPDDLVLFHDLESHVRMYPQAQSCVKAIQRGIRRGTRLRYVNALCEVTRLDQPGQLDLMLRMLQHPRIDPAARDKHVGSAAFWVATHSGSREVVNYLLNHTNVDPSCDGSYPIAWMAMRGFEEELDLALQYPKVDPCRRVHNQQPLLLATVGKHWECVRRLLREPRVNPTLPVVQCTARKVIADMPADLIPRFFP